MSIKDAAIPIGATVSASGGTSTSVQVVGGSLTETSAYLASSGVTQLTRTNVDFSVRQPKPAANTPGGFTQGRSKIKFTVPKVLANSNRTLNTMTIELAVDPETTDAEITTLLNNAALVIIDTDFSQFWKNQSAS